VKWHKPTVSLFLTLF